MTVRLLQVEPTTRCNFTCGFCAGRHLDQSDLPLADFEALLDQLPDVEHLELQGEGEPLMHPDFFAMAARARARGIEVSTISNGSFFDDAQIAQILQADIGSILVSIESADAQAFRAIRGGSLDKVTRGIRALVEAKRRAGRRRPHLGFAVTNLADTQEQLAPIVDLYESLGMDGGVLVHFLSEMDVYTATYDAASAARVLGPVQQALAWSRSERVLGARSITCGDSPHFWAVMMSRAERDRDGRGGYRSCPWLDQGLFVDRNGQLTACPNVKDSSGFGWGRANETDIASALHKREQVRARLLAGEIPTACEGCYIATSVARRRTVPRHEERAEVRENG
jgi:MoaA/NifB/PqqE/SkfB family radical SAM enzyme